MSALVNIFLLFLKINFLTASGPASYGLTEREVVGKYMTQTDFARLVAIASGTPGSDAVQMAWQVGWKVAGLSGSIAALLGALIPPVLLVVLLTYGLTFVPPAFMNKFINGIKPTLAILLVITAFDLVGKSAFSLQVIVPALLSLAMFYFRVPVYVILLLAGTVSLVLK